MPSLLSELGVNRFFIQVVGLRGKSAASKGTSQVSRSEWINIVPKTAQKAAKLGISVIYPKVFLERGESFECAGLCAENYFIFPNGRVYRCPVCEDYPLHSLVFKENRLVRMPKINENDMFGLEIPEGCVMNRLVQPENLQYGNGGEPEYRIACCMLKQEIEGE